MAKVDGVSPAPDADPGHLLPLHPRRQSELHVLAGVAGQGRVRAGWILNPQAVTASTLRASSSPNIEEGIRGLTSVTEIFLDNLLTLLNIVQPE